MPAYFSGAATVVAAELCLINSAVRTLTEEVDAAGDIDAAEKLHRRIVQMSMDVDRLLGRACRHVEFLRDRRES